MMKKITALLVVLTTAPSLFAWGLLSNAFEGTSLLPELLGKQNPTLKVCVRELQSGRKGALFLEIEDRELQRKYVEAFSNGLNGWFNAVRQKINESNRQLEFSDILTLIPQHVTVQQVKDCDAQGVIRLLYRPNDYSYQVGEALTKDNSWETHQVAYRSITLMQPIHTRAGSYSVRSDYRKTVAHEVGHLLGLSDQYGGCKFKSLFMSPYCDSTVLMGYADFNFVYNPDDVDGLINAIDFVLAYHNGQVTPRMQKGWKGFYGSTPYYYSYIRPFRPKSPDEDIAVKNEFAAYWREFLQLKDDWNAIGQYYINLQAEEDKLRKEAPGTMVSGKMRSQLTESDILDMMVDAKLMYLSNERQGLEELSTQISKVLGRPDASVNEVRAALRSFKTAHPQMPNVAYDMQKLNKTEGYFFIGVDEICAICGEPITDFTDRQEGRMTKKVGNRKTEYAYVAHSECLRPALEASERYREAIAEHNATKQAAARAQINAAPQPQDKYLIRGKKGVGHNGTTSLNYGELVEELKAVRARQNMPSKKEVDARVNEELHKHAPADSAAVKARQKAAVVVDESLLEDLEMDFPLEDIVLPSDRQKAKNGTGTNAKKTPANNGATKKAATGNPAGASKGNTQNGGTNTAGAHNAAANGTTEDNTKVVIPNNGLVKPAAIAAAKKGETVQPVLPPPAGLDIKTSATADNAAKTTSSTQTATAQPRADLSSTVGFVGPTAKVTCEICGEEIRVGQSYYKHGTNGIHRHNRCAYTFFAKQYAVDEKSLAKYSDVYWFSTPKDVVAATKLMKDLDLTVAQIRKFRSQDEYAKQQEGRKDTKNALRGDCASYQNVTEADLQNFEQANRKTLQKIAQKNKAKETLDAKEQRVQSLYEQMKKNKELTDKCTAQQRKAAHTTPTNEQLKTYPQAWTAFLTQVATFQVHANKQEKDENGVFKGSYELADLYLKIRHEKSYLFTMEMYAKINRPLASGSEYGSVADYLYNVLNGKEGKNVSAELLNRQMPLSASLPLNYKRQALATDKKAFPRYEKAVLQLRQLRDRVIRNYTLDKEMAGGETTWNQLSDKQRAALPVILKDFMPLAKELNTLRGQPEFKHVANGLAQHPLMMKNNATLDVARFLAAYGRWASSQNDGAFLATLGSDLLNAQK